MRDGLRQIVFGTESRAARIFDIVLIVMIFASLIVICLESVGTIRDDYGLLLRGLEWGFTGLFTVEYALRLWCARRPLVYARSFFGIVDLLSIVPTYLAVLFTGSQSLMVIRALRILRIFRVLKLAQFLSEAHLLMRAMSASRHKITVFLGGVLCVVVIVGALMHFVEGAEHGFTSIPQSMYWAIVTMTTVGYGDIAPETPLGQTIAAMLMVLGYGVIAVPTGIVSAELVHAGRSEAERRICERCGLEGHEVDSLHCRRCGSALPPPA